MEKYEDLGKNIGRGSFGEAGLVKSKETGEVLVLKKIILERLDNDLRKYADSEVKSMDALKHPFIVRLYETFAMDGVLCLIVEYCSNGNLHGRIRSRINLNQGPFSEFQTIKWGGQLLSAVAYAHANRVMHRDIKPDNIFLTADDDLKLGDFGASRFDSVEAGTFAGTITHMAPEMIEKECYTNIVDEWATGVVIFQLATLRLPFEGRGHPELMAAIKSCKFTYPISNITSKFVREIVERLIQPDESKRARAVDIMGSIMKFKYDIQDKPIGNGAFGQVKKATNRDTKEIVAVKYINIKSIEAIDLTRAKDEVEALKRFNHKNIVGFRDCFELPSNYCIILEFCPGGALNERITQRVRNKESGFPEPVVIRWGTELLSAVDYVHSKKTIHRDIKPHNVFLTSEDVVKLGDFGAVKAGDNANTAIGTFPYMAPEILVAQNGYNELVDEWSTGVVLFELSTLKLPFKAQRHLHVVSNVAKGEFAHDVSIIPYATVRAVVTNLLKVTVSERISAKVAMEMLNQPLKAQPAIALNTKNVKDSYSDEFQLGVRGVFGQASRVKGKSDDVLKLLKTRTASELASTKPGAGSDLFQQIEMVLQIKQSEFPAYLNKLVEHFLTPDGDYAVVYEFQRGGSIAKALADGKLKDRLQEAKLWAFTAQIGEAIGFLHSRNIVHRDIIPRNVFIRGETFKLGDLGIVKEQMGFALLKERGVDHISQLAPEIINGKATSWDKASDMWSFGCLLYEVASLKHPFAAANVAETVSNISRNIRMISVPPDRASPSFIALIDKLLIVDPKNRTAIQTILKMKEVAAAKTVGGGTML